MLRFAPSMSPLAALAKVVIDSLRNQVANPTVFLGTNPLNERQFVGKKKDRGADQVHVGSFLPSTACRRMSRGRHFAHHNCVLCVDRCVGRVGNRFESGESENGRRGDRGLLRVNMHEALAPAG